jgi:hypothetical protein
MITIVIEGGIIIGTGIGIQIEPTTIIADLTTENNEQLLTEAGDNLVVEL